MNTHLIHSIREVHPSQDKVRIINKNIMNLMRRLGGKVVNSSYILLDGFAKEAYGYYRFSKFGIVKTGLVLSNDSRCIFSVRFLGFENEINNFNKIKRHLEEAIKRSGLNKIKK